MGVMGRDGSYGSHGSHAEGRNQKKLQELPAVFLSLYDFGGFDRSVG